MIASLICGYNRGWLNGCVRRVVYPCPHAVTEWAHSIVSSLHIQEILPYVLYDRKVEGAA